MNYWGNWYIKFLILDMKFRFTTMVLVKSKNTMNWIVANFLRCQWHFLWIHSIIPNTGDSDNQYFTGTLKTWFSFFIFFYSSFILSSFFPLGTVAQWNTASTLSRKVPGASLTDVLDSKSQLITWLLATFCLKLSRQNK